VAQGTEPMRARRATFNRWPVVQVVVTLAAAPPVLAAGGSPTGRVLRPRCR